MAILAFLLGALLVVGGFGSLLASLGLVPTEMGLLYAVCGVIAVSSGFIILAIAALIVRIDRLFAPQVLASEPTAPSPASRSEVEGAPTESALAEAEEDEVNANRSGHLPTLLAVEEAIAHPGPQPEVVGRYSAGGARYIVFSDGAIEAETDEGALRFAGMGEFKNYIANRKR